MTHNHWKGHTGHGLEEEDNEVDIFSVSALLHNHMLCILNKNSYIPVVLISPKPDIEYSEWVTSSCHVDAHLVNRMIYNKSTITNFPLFTDIVTTKN